MSAATALAARTRISLRAFGRPALNDRVASLDRIEQLSDAQIEAALLARYRRLVAAGSEPADALLRAVDPEPLLAA